MTTAKFLRIFQNKLKPIIGMIHIQALPGTPENKLSPDKIIEKALEEAFVYKAAGIDALMIENMHDVPYQKNFAAPEVTAMMAIIAHEIKQNTALPLGIQILAAANKEAIAAAYASGADFIRAEGFVYGHLADEGYIDSNAAKLLRYRKQINADIVAVFTDIKKKHSSHTITSDLDIVEMAKAAEFFLSDGLIITGSHTGEAADFEELQKVYENTRLPVFIGSGINFENIDKFFPAADAFIVGSYFKKDNLWKNELKPKKIKDFMEKVEKLRTESILS